MLPLHPTPWQGDCIWDLEAICRDASLHSHPSFPHHPRGYCNGDSPAGTGVGTGSTGESSTGNPRGESTGNGTEGESTGSITGNRRETGMHMEGRADHPIGIQKAAPVVVGIHHVGVQVQAGDIPVGQRAVVADNNVYFKAFNVSQ